MVTSFEINIKNKGCIRGIMNNPNKAAKYPCLIMCHGFTGNKCEEHFLFVKMARVLERIGIAVFRFDFFGSGESDGEFEDMTFSSEIDDCKNVLQYVKKLDYIDNDNINILGFSMGGAVSIAVSSSTDIIKNTILISPAGDMFNVFIGSAQCEDVYKYIDKKYIDFGGLRLSKNAIDDAFKYNIFEMVGKIGNRVLLIQGDKDECVFPLSTYKMKEILGKKAEINFVKGADHCYSKYEYQCQVIELVKKFVSKNISNK